MQEFFGLQMTGKLDAKTIEVMKKPRCGISDVSNYGHFYGKPKWDKQTITYRITEYTTDLSQGEVDATIAQAFKLYSDVTPLSFKQVHSDTADITILFKARNHGDFHPFDGPGNVLAHAMSPGPNEGGDAHFDEDEKWTLSSAGVNLLLVAAHEFGHALGLDHSRDSSALMYPTYNYVNTQGYQLPPDDKQGIQALYEPCDQDLVFDAAISITNELYFFKNNLCVWIHAGQNYWGVTATSVLPGYPKHISHFGFPASVTKIDAAVHVDSTRRSLFFTGDKYWSFDELTVKMDAGFPKFINADFPGIGNKVDAAFQNGDFLYFSDGAKQTEYKYSSRSVNRVIPNYKWLNCY
ncbi:hypothetical protein Q7C36_019759 [Tachysurus vachellii]|uniref:Peptidase metallopeptidase domain-containing protein n=1 Tax=Tachysurus vachellii TaxID=175792 RepID=A0AA88S7X7_TACVA|nr:hypothetical protein Q7C36_019759 [Tachysurus vachellii]